MKIQTLSLVTPPGCNAKCPYCVGRMTCKVAADDINKGVSNIFNLRKCIQLARQSGVTTAIITGKGEPTLFPRYIDDFVSHCENFPFVELQTNGILFKNRKDSIWQSLQRWRIGGLTHVAISVAHYEPEFNKKIFKDWYNLEWLIKELHEIGLTVRVNCIMIKGGIDKLNKVYDWDAPSLVSWAKENKIDQLTIRPVNVPDISTDDETYEWTKKHLLLEEDIRKIGIHLGHCGTRILRLPHGATIYNVNGQNVCLTDCLTEDEDIDEVRQIIFMPDGSVRYSWQHEGAILLR